MHADGVGQRLGQRHVLQRLAGRGRGRYRQGVRRVLARDGFAFHHVDALGHFKRRGAHGEGLPITFDQRRVLFRVVQRVVAVLEAAAQADQMVFIDVGQVAHVQLDVHHDGGLVFAEACKGQFQHHQLVARAVTVVGCPDDQRVARGVARQGVQGGAIRAEGNGVADQIDSQCAGGKKTDAIVTVKAGGGQQNIHERRVTLLGGRVGDGGLDDRIAAHQDVSGTAAQRQRRVGVCQQALVTRQRRVQHGQPAFDGAGGGLKRPVAAGGCGPGVIGRGRDVGAG